MNKALKIKLINYLRDFVTPERLQKIDEVLDSRTRYLTVVLEDIYQPHNASAVLRSCECFGIQDLHIIENENRFDPNKGVTIGADQWVSLYRYNQEAINNTERCFKQLKEKGYRIIATTPHKEEQSIDEISLDHKTALAFGAELDGLSDYALEQADGFAHIPMVGFSESFNISVGAAICLYEMTSKLRKSNRQWGLTKTEKIDLKLLWLEESVRASEKLKAKFLEEQGY